VGCQKCSLSCCVSKYGRIEAIDFEPITTAILSHWKSSEIDWENIVLSELNKEQAESGMGFRYHY
jgi:hypothetical protein